MLTAELVLLLAIYASLVFTLLFGPNGVVNTFPKNLPKLSARIEKHVVTGQGHVDGSWAKP